MDYSSWGHKGLGMTEQLSTAKHVKENILRTASYHFKPDVLGQAPRHPLVCELEAVIIIDYIALQQTAFLQH